MEISIYKRSEHSNKALERVRQMAAKGAARLLPRYLKLELPNEADEPKLPPSFKYKPEFACAIPAPRERDGNRFSEFRAVSEQRRSYTAQLKEQGRTKDIIDRLEMIVAEAGANTARYGDGGTFVALQANSEGHGDGTLLLFINGSRELTNHAVPTDIDEHGRGGTLLNAFATENGACFATEELAYDPKSEAASTRSFALTAAPSRHSTEVRWYFVADEQPMEAPMIDLDSFPDLEG